MSRTKQHAVLVFRAMAQYPAAAMIAGRRQGVYGAFKAVKDVRDATQRHLKCLVVIVSTDFADFESFFAHNSPPM